MSERNEAQDELDEAQEKLVEVGRYLDPAEAHMAKGLLDSAGVESFLQGENANAIVPMAFRTRLSVRHEDEAAASELLASAEVAEGDEVE
jgi:hypothetical protein